MSLSDIKETIAEYYYAAADRIPYFPYILGLIILLALGAGAYFAFFAGGGEIIPEFAKVSVLVKNAAGASVKAADINVSGLGSPLHTTTGTDGRASFEAEEGAQITVIVANRQSCDRHILFSNKSPPVANAPTFKNLF